MRCVSGGEETNRLDTTLRCFLSGAEFIFIDFTGRGDFAKLVTC